MYVNVMDWKWIPFGWRWRICREWVSSARAFKARLRRVFKIRQLESFPAGENPFWHDHFHTGVRLGNNLLAMNSLGGIDNKDVDYIILVHIPTGQRIRVDLPKSEAVRA